MSAMRKLINLIESEFTANPVKTDAPKRVSKEAMTTAAISMPIEEWREFVAHVERERRHEFYSKREVEATRLAAKMDMSPEGFVIEWVRHGRKNLAPYPAWERAYQRAGYIDAAEKAGYIYIEDDVRGSIVLTNAGEKLVRERGLG